MIEDKQTNKAIQTKHDTMQNRRKQKTKQQNTKQTKKKQNHQTNKNKKIKIKQSQTKQNTPKQRSTLTAEMCVKSGNQIHQIESSMSLEAESGSGVVGQMTLYPVGH